MMSIYIMCALLVAVSPARSDDSCKCGIFHEKLPPPLGEPIAVHNLDDDFDQVKCKGENGDQCLDCESAADSQCVVQCGVLLYMNDFERGTEVCPHAKNMNKEKVSAYSRACSGEWKSLDMTSEELCCKNGNEVQCS